MTMAQIHALTPEGRLPSRAVAHVQEVAEVALGTIPDRTDPVQKGEDDTFAITDQEGRVAFSVESDGAVKIGDTLHEEQQPGYRVMDQDGHVAFEVDTNGTTYIYDPSSGSGGGEDQEPETLHLFIAAGQSNMSGRGRPVEGPQSRRIKQFGANNRVIEDAPVRLDMVDSPGGTSPALFFADSYLAMQPDHVGVLLIPAARGATTFSGTPESPAPGWTWTKGAASSPEYALYERSVEQALDAIAAAEAAGYHVIVKGVIWHQGEGNGGMPTETYAEKLDSLIADYRADLDHSTLPFVVGRMSPEGFTVTPSKLTVDAAHQDTPYRTPFTGFAPSTRNGHNDGDTTHFSTVGTKHLGDTYVTGYIQALGNTHQHTTESATESAPEQTTGWIDLTGQITETTVTSGSLRIKRTGNRVYISIDELLVDFTGQVSLPRLDPEFRPEQRVHRSWYVLNSYTAQPGLVNISKAGYFNIGMVDPASPMISLIEYDTDRDFPS